MQVKDNTVFNLLKVLSGNGPFVIVARALILDQKNRNIKSLNMTNSQDNWGSNYLIIPFFINKFEKSRQFTF